jgi:hypothetical protein
MIRPLYVVNNVADRSFGKLWLSFQGDADAGANLTARKFYSSRNGLLYYNDPAGPVRLCVPYNKQAIQLILARHHTHPSVGHPGGERFSAVINRHYFWKGQDRDCRRYSATCKDCILAKPTNQQKDSVFGAHDTPLQPWDFVSTDFLMGLPPDDAGRDTIWVFTDVLSKRVRLFAVSKTVTAQDCVRIWFRHMFPLHGCPRQWIHDRDTRWVGTFWQELQATLGSTFKISPSNHHETAGSAERMNRTVEQVLRIYSSSNQSSWSSFLPFVEFALNSLISSATGIAPFVADGGYLRHGPLDLDLPVPSYSDFDAGNAADWSARANGIIAAARDAHRLASDRQMALRNRGLKERVFKVGDLVKVAATALESRESKLSLTWLGPFKVLEVVHHNGYRLSLPANFSRRHDVLDVSFLQPYTADDASALALDDNLDAPPQVPVLPAIQAPIPAGIARRSGRNLDPPLPVTTDVHDHVLVDIVGHRKVKRGSRVIGWEYLVQWRDLPAPVWETTAAFSGNAAKKCLRDYRTANPDLS